MLLSLLLPLRYYYYPYCLRYCCDYFYYYLRYCCYYHYYRDYPQLRNPIEIMVPVNLARRLAPRSGRAIPGVGRREMHPLGQGARSPLLGRAASTSATTPPTASTFASTSTTFAASTSAHG